MRGFSSGFQGKQPHEAQRLASLAPSQPPPQPPLGCWTPATRHSAVYKDKLPASGCGEAARLLPPFPLLTSDRVSIRCSFRRISLCFVLFVNLFPFFFSTFLLAVSPSSSAPPYSFTLVLCSSLQLFPFSF